MSRVHHRACTLCEAICGLEIVTEADRIVSIRGDKKDPLSRGHICPKALALGDLQTDPDRLTRPLRRNHHGYCEIPWEEALDETATRLRSVQERSGRDSVAVYLGNPNAHNAGAILYGPPFVRALGTRNRFSATSVDQLPHMLNARLMFGHQLLLPVPDLDHTQLLLMVGANPIASGGSIMTAPDVKKRLQAIQKRGGRVVVVDPRRTQSAALADEHLAIRPGHDALLLAALAHTLFVEGWVKLGHLATFTNGVDQVRVLLEDFSPQAVAPVIGIEADTIRRLARQLSAAEGAVCYGRMGVSVQAFGSLCQWLINTLNIITGNLDRKGGAMFTRPAVDLLPQMSRGGVGRWSSRVRGLPEFGGELPVAALAEEILTPGDGQIRGLVTVAGNPALSTPNATRLERGLAELDFMVSIDFYLNETTRHADIILPPTPPLEHDHYDLVFHLLAVRNTARYSPAVLPAAADVRHDWQILLGLASRLRAKGALGRLGWRLRRALGVALGPKRLVDLGLRQGPYGAGFKPWRRGLSLRRLQQEPHGIDLGELKPCLPARLFTKDKRIHLLPAFVPADLERLRKSLREVAGRTQDQPLLLIGRRHPRSNNSWLHNCQRLLKGDNRCTLLMHPSDATRLGLGEHDIVAVASRRGRVQTTVELSTDMMAGVVSLPHGWGHGREGVRLRVAKGQPGVSYNDLTDESQLDVPSGNAVLNGIPVQVERVDGPAG